MPAPMPAPAPAPAPAPMKVSTLPAGTRPATTMADCSRIQAPSVTAPQIEGADMQATSDVVASTDGTHSYAEFARLPGEFMYWVRASGQSVDLSTLGTAVHESNHAIDNALRFTCSTDGLARYFADDVVHVTGLLPGATTNYGIASETYPAALKTSRAARYDLYITQNGAVPGDDFSVMLDELNAYSGAANFEVKLLTNPSNAYLAVDGDLNLGGMVDFMLFTQSYLKAARLNHPASYSAIQSQAQTLSFLQFAWTRAEQILVAAYPVTTAAGSGGGQIVPVDALQAIYSAEFLAELDVLGITHKTAADFSSTYLH